MLEVPTSYEELENLPCIMIVVERARFGDTLPNSFKWFDLRARNTFNVGAKSTFRQDVGRACGYSLHANPNTRPQVLVSKAAEQVLDDDDEATALLEDYHMTKSGDLAKSHRWYWLVAEDESDAPRPEAEKARMREAFKRRMLLKAEPQVGKTGAYLSALEKFKLGRDLQLRHMTLEALMSSDGDSLELNLKIGSDGLPGRGSEWKIPLARDPAERTIQSMRSAIERRLQVPSPPAPDSFDWPRMRVQNVGDASGFYGYISKDAEVRMLKTGDTQILFNHTLISSP
jgi:hypothetical protein